MQSRSRRVIRLTVVAMAALALAAITPLASIGATPLPSSMASTGDSITRGYNTGFWPFSDNTASSWSTGTTSSVQSHYTRLRARTASINNRNYNDAKTGAVMADLNGQLTTVAARNVGYVTILMGANDVCSSAAATMTPTATFRAQFTTALQNFTVASPNTLIFVASIPNIYNLWNIEKGSGSARAIWALGKVCQSMLANPTSTSSADNARRLQVQQRNIDFNTQLAEVCATYAKCRFDNNATYNTVFTTSDVNTRDYFHPSPSGQAKLAAVTWAASYWAP